MKQGVCHFCGQIFMVDAETDNQEFLDEQASMQCSCDEAKKLQTFKARCEKAKKDAYLIFDEPEEDVMLEIIQKSVESIAQHKIDSIQIKLGTVTGTIKLDANDQFDIKKVTKVERSN